MARPKSAGVLAPDPRYDRARRFYVYKLIAPEVSQGCEMVNNQRRAMNRLIAFHNAHPRPDTEKLVLEVCAEMDIPTPRRMRQKPERPYADSPATKTQRSAKNG